MESESMEKALGLLPRVGGAAGGVPGGLAPGLCLVGGPAAVREVGVEGRAGEW